MLREWLTKRWGDYTNAAKDLYSAMIKVKKLFDLPYAL